MNKAMTEKKHIKNAIKMMAPSYITNPRMCTWLGPKLHYLTPEQKMSKVLRTSPPQKKLK
ncbi:hypothetical protein BK658_03755 [Pseudomonas brassicacearum]|uniref:Uncharacterized protein n=1 Tax=Pseudomonas brassicacearum TaxID=930166 RepID=A0A423H017_9PSED|nr:hypothetical protein BK658_03755 [Pseudomonas brassicacearum]